MATRSYELCVVTNRYTDKTSYYIRSCFQKAKRISKAKFGALYMQAERIDCVYSKNNGCYNRSYRTVYIQE